MQTAVLGIRLTLALVFGIAGLAKLADLDGSRDALRGFGVPDCLTGPTAVALPVIELLIAASLLVSETAWWALIAAAALLLVFIGAIALSVVRGRAPECHCFGQLHSQPASWRTLARNGALAILCGVALAAGPHAGRMSASGWVAGLTPASVILVLAILLLIAVLAMQGWFVFELLRQHGRILGRLEALEARASESRAGPDAHNAAPALAIPPDGSATNGHTPGLPIGAVAPDFDLTSLGGPRVSLATLRAAGTPVLLIFSDPGCGPCNALLPDIADWQRLHAEQLTIVIISRAGADSNRAKAKEHRLRDVLLQEDREVSTLYQARGTPSAVMVSVDGRIASSLSSGAVAISALVEGSVAPGFKVLRAGGDGAPNGHDAAPVMSAGLAIGSDAPSVTLEDLDGKRISLRKPSKDGAVLLFWNPRCGFCQRMLPDLRAWEHDPPPGAPALLLISTGDAESNRTMGLRSRVVLDQTFQTARSFGASGTPSAVRIDPTGRILTPLAVGASAALALLGAPQPAQLGNRIVREVV